MQQTAIEENYSFEYLPHHSMEARYDIYNIISGPRIREHAHGPTRIIGKIYIRQDCAVGERFKAFFCYTGNRIEIGKFKTFTDAYHSIVACDKVLK